MDERESIWICKKLSYWLGAIINPLGGQLFFGKIKLCEHADSRVERGLSRANILRAVQPSGHTAQGPLIETRLHIRGDEPWLISRDRQLQVGSRRDIRDL